MNDNPADFNNDHTAHCDRCNSRQMGTEFYCNDAMGMATPVLWVCHRCENPPALVRVYREIVRRATNAFNKAKYYATTTPEYRAKRRARMEQARGRIAARRAAQ